MGIENIRLLMDEETEQDVYQALQTGMPNSAAKESLEQVKTFLKNQVIPSTKEYHDGYTLFKVHNVLMESGMDHTEATAIINELQNVGIIFRERVPVKTCITTMDVPPEHQQDYYGAWCLLHRKKADHSNETDMSVCEEYVGFFGCSCHREKSQNEQWRISSR